MRAETWKPHLVEKGEEGLRVAKGGETRNEGDGVPGGGVREEEEEREKSLSLAERQMSGMERKGWRGWLNLRKRAKA